jgi:glycosyltransferase involved in cell wall biosynthesis
MTLSNTYITVFTPTYNRSELLVRLYESLKMQNNKNFEWVIVDDGSSDNTTELVELWQHEQKVQILYYKQLNGGKHRAINKGISLANGLLFFIVDSDDFLLPESIDIIINKYNYAKNKFKELQVGDSMIKEQ